MREEYLAFEERWLSPFAQRSAQSRGRAYPMEACRLRTDFQRDRDRIIHCKSFRRLKHKTQCFLSPEQDHYRTRLTHTLEVSQIARTIGRAMRLNEDLIEAISLAHDLGHTPFGHTGERTLARVNGIGFAHHRQSLRVVEVLEGDNGLNLTWEVRDGIVNHTIEGHPATVEGQVVSMADRIAYINHDIDDALRGGVIRLEDIPRESLEILGMTHGERIDTLVTDMVEFSQGKQVVGMSDRVDRAHNLLREFMFEAVYLNPKAKKEESKADHVMSQLFSYFMKYPHRLPPDFYALIEVRGQARVITDYIAGMTDRYAVACYQSIFVPSSWNA